MNRPAVVVLGWTEGHRRTAALAAALGVEPRFMPWARHGRGGRHLVTGWVRSAVRTVGLVRGAAPDAVVVVQAPPVFAPLVAVAARRRGQRIVVDAHSGAFNDERWAWAHGLQRRVLARCDLLVVTNEGLVADEGLPPGLRVAVAHDVLEHRADEEGDRVEEEDRVLDLRARTVVFPASGAPDEPLDAVRGAAALLADRGFEVVVTGRQRALVAGPGLRPSGWLDERAYEDLLRSSVCVLALTTREHTMQRAAYEALERDLPVVCSDTAALREAFGGAAEYAAPTAAGIAEAVLRADARRPEMVALGRGTFARMAGTTERTLDVVRDLVGTSPLGSGSRTTRPAVRATEPPRGSAP